jgi:hypothetical protein
VGEGRGSRWRPMMDVNDRTLNCVITLLAVGVALWGLCGMPGKGWNTSTRQPRKKHITEVGENYVIVEGDGPITSWVRSVPPGTRIEGGRGRWKVKIAPEWWPSEKPEVGETFEFPIKRRRF